MTYYLDSNVIIDLLNGNSKVLTEFKKAFLSASVRIPDLVYYEVLRGFEYTDPKNKKTDFEAFSERCGIEYMDLETFKIAAVNYANLKKQGMTIGDDDILIGSLAIERNAILVTNNTKHFTRLNGITLENWAK
jgi:predicted nucleic acid-binding protein